MNDLLTINYDSGQPTVSARDLHQKLGIEKRFSAWFEANSSGFIENEDFTSVLTSTVVNNGAERPLQDYSMTTDMAKHIALMSRTEKGKECRQALIQLEKDWNTPEKVMARALQMANQRLEDFKKQNVVLISDNERMKPKEIFADSVSASEDTILVSELAKILKANGFDTGEKRLYQYLRENGYLIKRKGTDYNIPTQRSMELGLFVIKETAINRSNGRISVSKTPKVTGKGQQYFINKLLAKDINREVVTV